MPEMKRTGNNDFDIAFLGDSLAGRLAAALLAKKGCRVLMIHESGQLSADWLTSSLLLERLLDFLDGRSCSTTSFPFQIITRSHRVDINGKIPLADELRRELSAESGDVMTFLDDMKALGEQLEELLWDHQGLPTQTIGNRLRFRKNCFRADIPRRVFTQTLRDRISAFKEPGARKILTALFCGFSFTPADRLSLAECALIWSGLGRQSGVVKSGLEELLWHRYKQFHGEERELHRLARVRTAKDGTSKFLFEDEQVLSARYLVFNDRETVPLCEGLSAPSPARLTRRHQSGNIRNRKSPLLAKHVIVDGNPPLRLHFSTTDKTTLCAVENAVIGEQGLSTTARIENRLGKILPFVDLALTPTSQDVGADVSIRSEKRPTLMAAYDKIDFEHGHKFLCSGAAVLPELGTVGEVLVALTVTNKLLLATGRPAL